jgi:23S rRNA pseudouridine1911/1915/1917 synthase
MDYAHSHPMETNIETNSAETTHLVTIAADAAGGRLDRALADALPMMSRSRLKALIETGCISLTDAATAISTNPTTSGATIDDPSYRVKSGQNFVISVPEAEPALPEPQDIPLEIMFEDDDLLVINKPAGLVVHPAPGNRQGTMVNALLAHCGDSLSGIGGVRRPGIIHRLDKDTSGLIVVAKNDLTHNDLSAQFKARTIKRVYHAVVWGRLRPASGEIEGNIGRSPRDRKKMAMVERGGKTSLTRYLTLQALDGGSENGKPAASLVECRLATGRTHQIRVHMTHMGHPVIGDPTYGGQLTPARRAMISPEAAEAVKSLGRQALHAALLGFRHPKSGADLVFERGFPAELEDLVELLSGHRP